MPRWAPYLLRHVEEHTGFCDLDSEFGEGNEAHGRSYDERSLDPRVVFLELLDGRHGYYSPIAESSSFFVVTL
jgi:hypothetical protein